MTANPESKTVRRDGKKSHKGSQLVRKVYNFHIELFHYSIVNTDISHY